VIPVEVVPNEAGGDNLARTLDRCCGQGSGAQKPSLCRSQRRADRATLGAVRPSDRLGYGQFFGDCEVSREVPGFSLSLRTPDRNVIIERHTHEEARSRRPTHLRRIHV